MIFIYMGSREGVESLLSQVFGCNLDKLPMTYLGFPLTYKSRTKKEGNQYQERGQPVIKKFEKRLAG